MTEIPGLDFSDAKPDPSTLTRDGFQFVVGYVKPLLAGGVPNSKELTADYIARARAAGLAVAVVFESTADRALSGAAGGAADGATAKARAAALGYPADAVIFWAVDFPVSAAQMPTVLAYGDAFAAAVGHPDGGYGSFAFVEALAAHRSAAYRWQTAGWSGANLSQYAHLYQRNHKHWPDIAGTDENILCAGFPWFGAAAPAPTPPPAPAPAPPPHPPVLGWNLPPGNYYGNIAGPRQSHGGATPAERVFVTNIQRWLVYHGCADGIPASTWATTGWADGKWQHPTDTAMANWHARFYRGQPKPTQCWSDDYARLARP